MNGSVIEVIWYIINFTNLEQCFFFSLVLFYRSWLHVPLNGRMMAVRGIQLHSHVRILVLAVAARWYMNVNLRLCSSGV